MPKRHQQRPAKEIHGRNKAEKSTVITTGTYKKKETYEEQARAHENPAKLPQKAKVPPKRVIPPEVTTKKQDSEAMMEEGERRSGATRTAKNPARISGLLKEQIDNQQLKLLRLDIFVEN